MNVGHIWRIKDGREEEYDGRHATIWPELESLFHRLGVREYHIYRRGSTVVSHLEVDDYAALKREYGLDPVATRWEQHFGDILEYPNADAEGSAGRAAPRVVTARPPGRRMRRRRAGSSAVVRGWLRSATSARKCRRRRRSRPRSGTVRPGADPFGELLVVLGVPRSRMRRSSSSSARRSVIVLGVRASRGDGAADDSSRTVPGAHASRTFPLAREWAWA